MKDTIKKILREGILDKTIKRIAVFDFDGTLIDTDTPESGKTLWLNEFGFKWPFTGWWGRPESLDSRIYFENNGRKLIEDLIKKLTYDEIEKIIHKGLNNNIFKNEPIISTLNAYREQSEIPNTLIVLLTGRHSGVGGLITKILDSKNLIFDDYIYKTGSKETHEFKIDVLNKLVSEYPNLEEINIWEDRDDHLPVFKSWANQQVFNANVYHITDATK